MAQASENSSGDNRSRENASGKTIVGLLFGGRSGEHDVSIRSAQAIASGFQSGNNPSTYDVRPFYINRNGIWQSEDTSQAVLTAGVAPEQEDATEPIALQARWQFPETVADVDVWFPILHGPNGEDGSMQGLFQLMGVPHVGPGLLGSCMGMDKLAMKMAFAQAGLPQVK